MKPILLALVTLALTLNALGLELVKCGSVKIPEGFTTNDFQYSAVGRTRPDGTTLFKLGDWPPQYVVLKPFIGSTGLILGSGISKVEAATNNWNYSVENGITTVSFTRTVETRVEVSAVDVIFHTFSDKGYLDQRQVTFSRFVEDVKIINGIESRSVIENSSKEENYFCKIDLDGRVLEKISIDGDGFIKPKPISNPFWSPGAYNINRRFLIPKLNGDSIDFYLVTDPDLFPDTALGAPRVEGGSATFNVTTGSEVPVEIQASDDLKIWKRLKTLEDANGRSVTVPADAAQGFLRAVEF